MMNRRPKPGESEDDLLKFQEEFLANKGKSSATVVKKADKHKPSWGEPSRDVVSMEALPSELPSTVPPVKKSRFRSQQEEKHKTSANTQKSNQINEDIDVDLHDRSTATVLSKIIERDTRNLPVYLPRETTQAFPTVHHRGNINQVKDTTQGQRKKKSMFSQQFSQMLPKDFGVMVQQEERKTNQEENTQRTQTKLRGIGASKVIEGTGLSATFGKDEAEKIHAENVEKLSALAEVDILEEQKKLLEMLDPKLVAFITSKNKKETQALPGEITRLEAPSKQNKPSETDMTIDESDLPFKPKQTWLNMDKLECDKLYWMKELPPPKTGDIQTGQQARFDFNGHLVPADAEVPVTLGLHHHGEEPERAGYTLEELFQLARSTNVQQRVLALNTMAKIFLKTRNGDLDGYVQTSILPAVIDGGVVFLLRWALDDTIDTVMVAAVSALHNLIVNTADMANLDRVFPWYQGHIIPCHRSQQEVNSQQTEDDNDEKIQETDADILQKDVIQCLVERMNLLPRLRYIVEKWHPQAPTVLQILRIITRIVIHSTQLAYQVSQCHSLLQIIFKQFLPTTWTAKDNDKTVSDLYGSPVPEAMKLMRFLVSSGRHLAANLISAHHLQACLMRYLVDADPQDLQIPNPECYRLQIESMRVLKVCLLYGHAVDTFIDLFPVFVERLRRLQQDTTSDSHISDRQICHVETVGVLEAALHVAGASVSQKPSFVKSEDGNRIEVERSQVTAPAPINWGHVSDLLNPVVMVTIKLMDDIQDSYQFKKHDLQLLTACLNFVSSYYAKWSSQDSHDSISCLQTIEDYLNKTLVPCWKKFGFQVILRNLSQSSNILEPPSKLGKREKIANLLDLGSSSDIEEIPVLKKTSPFGMMVAILRQIYIFCNIHKGIRTQILSIVVNQEDIITYLKKVTTAKSNHLYGNHFTKTENLFQYFYLKITCLLEAGHMGDLQKLQHLTLLLLTRLHHGDEYLIHDILSTVLFKSSLWSSVEEEAASRALAELKLADITHLQSTTAEEVNLSQEQLLMGAKSRLSAIRSAYLKTFGHSQRAAIKSRNLFMMNPLETQSLFTTDIGDCLLPKDWMYVPLIDLYNIFCNVGADVQSALSTSEVDTVSSVLQWVYLLERCHKVNMSDVSVTLKVSRIMCAFLTGNDLFLDKTVHCYLAALLREFVQPAQLDQMDFEETIPGLVSFYDLFTALLQQYDAVSFGDSVFGCFVLLPLQQKHHIQLRKALWTEYTSIMRTLYLPVKELLIPIERYLVPEESSEELIGLYLRSVMSLSLRPKWAPILYLIAVHHVNRFVYLQDGSHLALKNKMLQQIYTSQKQEVKHHLLYYKMADVSKPFGMELYETLPPQREKMLQGLQLT